MKTIDWIVLTVVGLLAGLTVTDNKLHGILMDLKIGDPRTRLYQTIISEIDKTWNTLMAILLILISLHPLAIIAISIYAR